MLLPPDTVTSNGAVSPSLTRGARALTLTRAVTGSTRAGGCTWAGGSSPAIVVVAPPEVTVAVPAVVAPVRVTTIVSSLGSRTPSARVWIVIVPLVRPEAIVNVPGGAV